MAFDFVDDIFWEEEASRRGLTLLNIGIGYAPNVDATYAALLGGGGALIWQEGEFSVETKSEFAARQQTHEAITFP